MTDKSGNMCILEIKAGTVFIKQLFVSAGYKVDTIVYPLEVQVGKWQP